MELPKPKPTTGIEPATFCLRSRRSTTKLHWHPEKEIPKVAIIHHRGCNTRVRRPGIEPGPSAWKADILTTRPTTLRRTPLTTSRVAGKCTPSLRQVVSNLTNRIPSGRVAQWIRRRSSEPKIVGSSPTVVSSFEPAALNMRCTKQKNAHRGARTHDHKVKSLALYQLS